MNFWSCWYMFRLHLRFLTQIRRDFQCTTQHSFINVNQWRFLCYSLQFSSQIVTKLCQNLNFFELPEIARCYFTTVFVDTRLSKTKRPRKRFQNFRQSCMLSTDRSDLSITRMIDGNFGNVSAGVLIWKVAFQGKRWWVRPCNHR